jgi:hypothetical protein
MDAHDSSTVTMNGGTVSEELRAYGSSTITMNGGTLSSGEVWDGLFAHDSSTIWIVGNDFAVDGIRVSYGDLAALSGRLTGTLASGDPIGNIFHQGGGSWTGTITLVPEPTPTPTPTPTPVGKVTLCHKGKKTISVGASAVPAHQRHGDTLGPCD